MPSALAVRWRAIEAAGTRSLLQHLLCSSRTSIGKLSERRVSVMHLRSRRVSGAADREQPCGLAAGDQSEQPMFSFEVEDILAAHSYESGVEVE